MIAEVKTGMFREESGKLSFGRIFGAAFLLSVLCGWWLSVLGPFIWAKVVVLPELTEELLLISVTPYGIGKMATALQRNNRGST